MTRRTKAQWQSLIEAQAHSGQTAAAFCREHGVDAKYFSLRRGQLREGVDQKVASFVPVAVASRCGGAPITVRAPGGVTVELPVSIEPAWLAQLLHCLRG